MRKMFLSLSLSFCALLLFACQSQEEEITLLDNISSISISESDGYGGVKENYFMTIDEDAILSKFEEVFKKAEGRKQKVDVVKEKPDYDILVRYKNSETHLLNLVLGDTGEKSRVMYVGHENTGFDLSAQDTDVLRGILDNQ
ncbi:uncharacterized lipoprotein YehR (DUF1307 family) [Virgibacillus halotolerans]|uniref:hypothetical protein n=1 Tax=Virgibacillus halotolerans TaxID=1071053 RepID=UPI001960051D|nr:hypothetical protein [Virgibacillus halotolerans]MBM7600997.1 uncharacterized lipoprotein YehR (DUF1307 family) [Virgibacillus halotolerans]